MVRLTYVLETPSEGASVVQPVNLAFAAAAAARASWASKERDESLWDFEPLDDGAPGPAHTPSDDGLDVSFFFGGAKMADNGPGPSIPPASSRLSLEIGGVLSMAGASLSAVDGPDIHHIPRNSVLFRTHAAQQTMTSSLPPAEPNAPSALEVASVMEDRKSRGLVQVPSNLLRSVSLSPGIGVIEPAAGAAPTAAGGGEMRGIAESGTGSAGGGNGTPRFGKVSYNVPYTGGIGVNVATAPSAALGALSSPGGVGASDQEDRTGDMDGDGDGERDGCLVLPVLRTLLAMQDDAPAPRPVLRHNTQGLNHVISMNSSHHGGSHFYAHGNGNGGPAGGGGSSSVSRQPSMAAFRGAATSSTALNNSHGVSGVGGVVVLSGGGGGSLARQGTVINGSPARRRVAGPDSPMLVGRPSLSLKRQQSIKPLAVHITAGMGGGFMQPSDDDDSMDPMGHTMSYSASTSPMSPIPPSLSQFGGRHATRAPSGLGMVPAPPVGSAAGGGPEGGLARGLSPQTQDRARPNGAARVAAGAKPQTGQQPQGSQQLPLQPQPPSHPPPQQEPGQSGAKGGKSGKALFAWTNKISKGKWHWFPGGGSGGPASAGPASPVPPAVSGMGSGRGGDGSMSAAAAAALAADMGYVVEGSAIGGVASRRGSLSSNGRISASGRVSGNGGGAGGPPRSPVPAPTSQLRDAVSLPPIDYWRKSNPSSFTSTGLSSPMVMSLEGEPGGLGAAAMARVLYDSAFPIASRR